MEGDIFISTNLNDELATEENSTMTDEARIIFQRSDMTIQKPVAVTVLRSRQSTSFRSSQGQKEKDRQQPVLPSNIVTLDKSHGQRIHPAETISCEKNPVNSFFWIESEIMDNNPAWGT